jgi:hypothetical protein
MMKSLPLPGDLKLNIAEALRGAGAAQGVQNSWDRRQPLLQMKDFDDILQLSETLPVLDSL